MPTPSSVSFIHRRSHTITATCSLLKTLPTTTCAVCMDDFHCLDKLLRLPNCHHVFHRHCILPWLSTNNTCPLCRRAFPPDQPPPPPPTTTIYNNSQPRHLRRQTHSVPIRIHQDYQQQHTSELTSHTVYHLNFHLRPPSSDSELPQQPTGLARLLIAEGFPEWAYRACGPFWISTDSINLESNSGEQLILDISTNVIDRVVINRDS